MSGIQGLREKKNALAKELNNMLANQGDQVWPAEKQAEFDAKAAELETVNDQLEKREKYLSKAAQQNFSDIEAFKLKLPTDPKAMTAEKATALAAYDVFLRKKATDYTPEERVAVSNVMSTTTGTQGGYTVQTLIASELIDALKGYGWMRRVASQQTTSNGADMNWPTSDGTAETGEWIAQNTTATAGDPTFGTIPVNVFKLSSKIITIPIELLQDTSIDMLAFINRRIRDRMGRTMNAGYTVGTGTGQPFGLSTQATVGKVGTTGQTLTVIYDDLVDLIDSLDAAYLPDTSTPDANGEPGWMFNQTVRRVIRKIKDTAGRPIWTPSYDEGFTAKTPDRLLGYPIYLNNDMPVPAANAKSIAFGLLNQYLIRDAMDVTIFRFDDSPYMSKGQVGYLAWARTGGNLLDVNAVKQYQHSAT